MAKKNLMGEEFEVDGDRLVVSTGGVALEAALQDEATVTGEGTPADLNGRSQTTLLVDGTASSFTLVIEGQVSGSTRWDALEVIKRGSLEVLQSISEKGLYSVDTTGLSRIRADLTAIASGNITVLAR